MKLWFDGRGGVSAEPAAGKGAFTWVHVEPGQGADAGALEGDVPDALVRAALTAPDPRPRCTVMGDGAIVILRGVKLTDGVTPGDMVSIRLWLEPGKIVSYQTHPLNAITRFRDAMEAAKAPKSPGEFVAKLALRLAASTEPVVGRLNEAIDALEDDLIDGKVAPGFRRALGDARRTAIKLRRFLLPQRDALSTLEIEDLTWLHKADRTRLREASERVIHLGEELDAIRDRAQVVHDEISDLRAERMNDQMLVLSVVASLFLPLGLLTGLLGINVGGMPGLHWPWAFWVVCALLAGLFAIEWWLFRRIGLLRRKD